ncbi:MAG: hypothetical protein MJA32_04340 [Proteobacteria bacterium]|nr:hypothetical protein [Pseudomonadota bacterium]
MSRSVQWRKIFGFSKKPTVKVRLGDRLEKLTDTQAYRFEELNQKNTGGRPAESRNPFEASRYSLEDAAFRLMVGDEAILQMAASGSVDLYTSVAGLVGCWRQEAIDGSVVDSPEVTLRSGYLALTLDGCRDLARRGQARVSRFEFKRLPDPSVTELDGETLAVLSTWDGDEVSFVAREPRTVEQDDTVLLAPLPARK